MITFIRKKLYRAKKNLVKRLHLELNQINFVDFVYSGSKVYHDNKNDHIAVIKTTLVNDSHGFSFCSQAQKLELIYHDK